MQTRHRPEYEICHNVKLKTFPLAGMQKMTICSKSIFREPGWDEHYDKPKMPTEAKETAPSEPKEWWEELEEKTVSEDDKEKSRSDSVNRSKQRVYEYALLNPFTHFITWTLDKTEIDRYDAKEVSLKLKKYLQNMVQRNDLKYLIIPEHHADGAIHMHGLISGNMKYTLAKNPLGEQITTKRGQLVYNMPQWKYGWSTAIELDGNVQAIARYITKYVTKDLRKIFGNFYYAGGKLTRQPKTELLDCIFSDIEAQEYQVKEAGVAFKYINLDYMTEETENDYPDDIFDIA